MKHMKKEILEQLVSYFDDNNLVLTQHQDGRKTLYKDLEKLVEKALDEYADWKIKECLPGEKDKEFLYDAWDVGYREGFNACIDQILTNKDKIK